MRPHKGGRWRACVRATYPRTEANALIKTHRRRSRDVRLIARAMGLTFKPGPSKTPWYETGLWT